MVSLSKPPVFSKPVTELNYLSFAEERLDLGYDYGAIGGPGFKTEIIEVADEREQRNITRWLSLGRWQLGNRLVADSELDKLAEVSKLKQFHNDRLGSFEGFRFKDWADYLGVNQYIATGDGVKTDFQLRKAYKAENAVTYRPIQKPVIGTVEIFVDGVAVDLNDWIINHETGVLNNPVALENGAVLTASFEFDVPVWFESDQIGFRLEGYDPGTGATLYQLESVFVLEGRIPLSLPWEIEPLPEITQELDLGIVYETVEQFQFATNKLPLASGYIRRESKRTDRRILFNLGNRNYVQAEIDQILGYFYCAKGKAGEFPFVNLNRNFLVRFDQDQLNFKFEAARDDDALFSLSGLKLQLKEELIYLKPPFSVELESFSINPEFNDDPIILQSNTQNYSNRSNNGINNNQETLENLEQTEFTLNTYETEVSGAGGGEILPPGGNKPTPGNYEVKHAFWVANSLFALVAHSSHPYVHYLYKVTILNDSYILEYTYRELENYKLLPLSISNKFTRIFSADDGIYVISAADDDISNLTSVPNHQGILIWKLSNSGSESVTFIPNSVEPSLSDLGQPNYVIENQLFLYNFAAGNQIIDLGNWLGLDVYVQNIPNLLYNFPLPENLTLDSEEFLLPGRIAGKYNVSNPGFEYDRIIENADTELYAFYSSGANATPLLEFGAVGKDGSAMAVFQSRHYCVDNQPSCSTTEDDDYFQVFHKAAWADPWQLIDDQNKAISGDATNFFQNFSLSQVNHPIVDKNGNFLACYSGNLIFYRHGSGNAIFLNGLIPSINVNYYRDATPTDSYGIAAIFHQGDLFSANANPKILFIQ